MSTSALTTAELDRLDRFGVAFDRLPAAGYAPLAARPDPEVTERATAVALAHLASTSRRAAVREVVASFQSAAARAYSDRMSLPDTILVFQSLTDRGEDRARFQAGLERAIVAVILWDELGDDDLAALLGPWATFVETALAAEAPG